MNKKLYTFIALFAASLLLGIPAANASHSWSGYHWDLSTTQTEENPLELGDNLSTTEWRNSLGIASDDWNRSVIKNTVATGLSNNNCDPTAERVEVCNDTYGDNGWLGIAQIWTYRGKNRDHIGQAVVKLNDSYYNTSTYNTSAWRNFVMCQEVGHVFGLAHQDEEFTNENLGTCMDYTNDPDGTVYDQSNNEHPNTHDYDMLNEIYAHINNDSGNKGNKDKGGGKGNGKGPNKNDLPQQAVSQSDWGQAVSFDARGRADLYEAEQNGFTVYTHVTWVQ